MVKHPILSKMEESKTTDSNTADLKTADLRTADLRTAVSTHNLIFGARVIKESHRPRSRRNARTCKDNWVYTHNGDEGGDERTKKLVVLISGGHIVTSERGHRKIVFYLHITLTQRGVSVEIQGTTQNIWVTSTHCTQCDVHFFNKGTENPPSYQLNQISLMKLSNSDPTSVRLVLDGGGEMDIMVCDDFRVRFDGTVNNLVPGGIISIE